MASDAMAMGRGGGLGCDNYGLRRNVLHGDGLHGDGLLFRFGLGCVGLGRDGLLLRMDVAPPRLRWQWMVPLGGDSCGGGL